MTLMFVMSVILSLTPGGVHLSGPDSRRTLAPGTRVQREKESRSNGDKLAGTQQSFGMSDSAA